MTTEQSAPDIRTGEMEINVESGIEVEMDKDI